MEPCCFATKELTPTCTQAFLLILLVEGKVSYDVTLDQCGGASFDHDIVPECPWPSSSLVQVRD